MSGHRTEVGVLRSSHHYTWNSADALGRGATAVVFLGRHKASGQVVAVKVFHSHLRYSHCKEDLPELEILRRLKHENIITVLGIEQEVQTKQAALIMEYCEGGSVMAMLDQAPYRYGLPEVQFLLVLYHVAAGMQYLRKAGVVHRDIKPANIMRYVTEDGSSVYKLTDFGAARQLDDGENFTSLYGTEEYLHPEMYQKGILRRPTDQQFDARTDLWSLGVTFYQAATGQLPFQPYGGRSNKETMYRIISQKESGVISGRQQFDGGPIQWARHLPNTCLLSSGLRGFITPLLADLMEANLDCVLTYEAFFSRVQRLKGLVPLSVFDYQHCTQHSLLLDPEDTFAGLQDTLASVTEVPRSQQLLVVGGHAMEDVVTPLTPVSTFPTHLLLSTLYLFHRDSALTQPPPLAPPEIPVFPEFLNVTDINQDSSLALSCLARGHVIQKHTLLIGQRQQCLVQGHLYLRMYVEARLQAVGEALQLIQQLVEDCRKRCTTFYSSVQAVQAMLVALGHRPDPYFRDVLHDQVLVQVQQKTEERVAEIVRYKEGLQGRLKDTLPHTVQWSELCQKTSCSSKVEHQLSVITQIQSRFRRDKSVKDLLTRHDENIHGFERQKLQETCTRLLSFLSGHCVPALERLHKQAFEFTGALVKALARIIKVEKNNESVIDCQQRLTARLDKMEAKCQDEIQHLQKQLANVPRGQPQQQQNIKLSNPEKSSVDDGLGTSVLGSGSVSRLSSTRFSELQDTAQTRPSFPGSLESVSVQSSLQSLRLDSEEVLRLVMDNLDVMKRLEGENIQSGTS